MIEIKLNGDILSVEMAGEDAENLKEFAKRNKTTPPQEAMLIMMMLCYSKLPSKLQKEAREEMDKYTIAR